MDQTPVPPIVHDVVCSPGQPLDPATRAFMEPRFGHDFSNVRVHADAKAAASARAVDALAYTVGQNLVFRDGQYRPRSLGGWAMIAHELAHTMQQETASSKTANESPALEQEANRATFNILTGRPSRIAATAAVPGVQFLKVTNGGFGRALEDFTDSAKPDENIRVRGVSDDTIKLLRTSPTFMGLARRLDDHYEWHRDSVAFNAELDASGRIAKGDKGMPPRMIGKRVLRVERGEQVFLPYNLLITSWRPI